MQREHLLYKRYAIRNFVNALPTAKYGQVSGKVLTRKRPITKKKATERHPENGKNPAVRHFYTLFQMSIFIYRIDRLRFRQSELRFFRPHGEEDGRNAFSRIGKSKMTL